MAALACHHQSARHAWRLRAPRIAVAAVCPGIIVHLHLQASLPSSRGCKIANSGFRRDATKHHELEHFTGGGQGLKGAFINQFMCSIFTLLSFTLGQTQQHSETSSSTICTLTKDRHTSTVQKQRMVSSQILKTHTTCKEKRMMRATKNPEFVYEGMRQTLKYQKLKLPFDAFAIQQT